MTVYRDADGREFDLPKMTLSLEEAYERAADRTRPKRERTREAIKLLRDAMGGEYVEQACGGKTAESVDVVALWSLFDDVRDSYYAEQKAVETERIMAQFDAIAPVLDKLAQIGPMVADQRQSRQTFARIR